MNIRYDQDLDAIYFELNATTSYDSDEIEDGIIIDYDQDNNVIGIEILNFKQKLERGLNIDTLPFPDHERVNAVNYFSSLICA